MLHIFGRMAPGMTVAQAQTELEEIRGHAALGIPGLLSLRPGLHHLGDLLHDELTKGLAPCCS